MEPKKSWYLGFGLVLRKLKTQTQTQNQISNFLRLNKLEIVFKLI
jgi:hypothetical protein